MLLYLHFTLVCLYQGSALCWFRADIPRLVGGGIWPVGGGVLPREVVEKHS